MNYNYLFLIILNYNVYYKALFVTPGIIFWLWEIIDNYTMMDVISFSLTYETVLAVDKFYKW